MVKRRSLQCNAREVRYDFARRAGTLFMPAGECCDMSGCISLFESIDPQVVRIVTISGDEEDTSYSRTDSGWAARHPKIGTWPADFLENGR